MNSNRTTRFVWFGIMIVMGMILGFYLGWNVFQPSEPVSSIADLRKDYQIDYVFMVAQAFQQDRDIETAVSRMDELTTENRTRMIQDLILLGREYGYQTDDLQLMVQLSQAITEYENMMGGQ